MRHFIPVPFAVISITTFPRQKYVPYWASIDSRPDQVKMQGFTGCQARSKALTNRLDNTI